MDEKGYLDGFTVCGDGGVQASGPHKGKRLVRLINYDYVVKMSRENVKSRSPGVRRRAGLVNWYRKLSGHIDMIGMCIALCSFFLVIVLVSLGCVLSIDGDLGTFTRHPVGWGIPGGACAVCAVFLLRVLRGYIHRYEYSNSYDMYRSKSGRSEERGYDYVEDRWNRTGDTEDRVYYTGCTYSRYCIMPYYIAYK